MESHRAWGLPGTGETRAQAQQQVDLKGEGVSWYVVKSWKFLEKEDNWEAPTPESERSLHSAWCQTEKKKI